MWQCMEIRGARVFCDGAFHDIPVFVDGDRFVSEASFFLHTAGRPIDILDGTGLLLLPGLTDIHMHGAVFADVTDADAESLHRLLRYEAACGVTQLLATTLSLPDETLAKALSEIGSIVKKGGVANGAWLAGIHLEGPYLSETKPGAHDARFIKSASVDHFCYLNRLAGHAIRIISLAPETDGALDFMRDVRDDVRLSLAHTSADYDTASMAFAAGASHVTHLFNAMPPLHHREPGVIGAALLHDDVSVELIADGVHVHPAVISAVFRMFPGRVCLVSDSMRATGCGDGTFDLGGQKVTVSQNRATLADGRISGSTTHLFDCLRHAVSCGIALETAIYAASEYPASRIGILDEAGTVKPGRRANFILAEPDLTIRHVFVNGQETDPGLRSSAG